MALEIKGRVIEVLEVKSGSGANGDWTAQDFVIETDGQYPKKVCFTCFKKAVPTMGQVVNVHFDIESKEHNGRWFTSARVWKFDVEGSAPTAPTAPTTTEVPF